MPWLLPILPEVMLVGGILLILLLLPHQRYASMAAFAAIVTIGVSLMAGSFVDGRLPLWHPDPLLMSGGYMLGIVSVLLILLPGDFLERHKNHQSEYYVLVLTTLLGARIMLGADNLLLFYAGLELMSFGLYIMAAFMRDDAHSTEAGLKYFVLGSLASGILLFGISLFYGVVGSTGYADIQVALANMGTLNPAAGSALLMIIVALLFKISVMPFHVWTPDVYTGAPLPVTALMATLPKLAGILIFIKILSFPLMPAFETIQPVLAGLAALTMLGGALLAVVQTSLKRIIAYSSIAQVGFIMCGLITGTTAGIEAALFYVLTYVLTVTGIFGCLLLLRNRDKWPAELADLDGLAEQAPLVSFGLLMCLFSLAGVPPFVGFLAKIQVFNTAIAADYLWLVICGVVASAIAVFYSLNILRHIFFMKQNNGFERTLPMLPRVAAVLGVVGSFIFFVWPQPVYQVAQQMAYGLFH